MTACKVRALRKCIATALLTHALCAGLIRALEVEALPPAMARRLTAGEAGASEARARYVACNKRAYVSRMGAVAARRFAPWSPRDGAAAALADVAAAERQHAELVRLAAAGAANAAEAELVRTADDALEEALLHASWSLIGHADEAAPAPTLVAGVATWLARVGSPVPRGSSAPDASSGAGSAADGDLPDALPPFYPEVRRGYVLVRATGRPCFAAHT